MDGTHFWIFSMPPWAGDPARTWNCSGSGLPILGEGRVGGQVLRPRLGRSVPVRAIKTITVSILAIGLLAGSAVGVAAQDEAADPMAPNWFTWEVLGDGPPEFSEDPTTGLPVITVQVEATDGRASGALTNLESFAQVEDDERYRIGSTSLRLVNDGGEWVGTSRFVAGATAGPNGNDVNGNFIEMAGRSGYEGLSLFVFSVFEGLEEAPVMRGFIVPTDVIPNMPEPSAD